MWWGGALRRCGGLQRRPSLGSPWPACWCHEPASESSMPRRVYRSSKDNNKIHPLLVSSQETIRDDIIGIPKSGLPDSHLWWESVEIHLPFLFRFKITLKQLTTQLC